MKKKNLVVNLFVYFCMMFSAVILLTACNKTCVHIYSDWVITTNYTCTTDGVKTRTCTKCNDTETEIIPASHTLTHLSFEPADCTHAGTLAHDYCSVCNKNFIDGVEKSDEQLTIPIGSCNFQSVAKVEPTCTENGVLAHLHCNGCNKNIIKDIEYTDQELIIPATHNLVTIDAKEKTSSEDGHLAYAVCRSCNKVFINGEEKTLEDTIIPASQEESTYVPYKLEAVCPFVVGRHTLNGTSSSDYNLKVYAYDKDTNARKTYYEQLRKMLPENSDFYTRLQELEQLVASGDTSSFPLTETFTFKCEQYEQQLTLTFDIERKSVEFVYPVYPKATDMYWGNESLGEFTVKFTSNFYDYTNECYGTDYVRLSNTTITDDGGFDINAELPEGKQEYTIKFKYNEQDYEASFVYVSDKFVIQEIRSISTEICCGEDPEVDLRYANGSCSSVSFKNLKVIAGKFDKRTPGVYTVTFATLDGFAKPVTVTITVRDKKDVKEILDDKTYYMAKGSNGFEVQVEYFDGTYGYEWIPLASIVEYEGEKLDATKVGAYKVETKIGDRIKKVNVNVYDPDTRIITSISSSVEDTQTLVWTKDADNNIIYDLNGLYIMVEYNDGTYEILPITKEMISCQEDGDNITVNVTYKEKTCTFNAIIGDKTATGYTLDYVFVGKDLVQYEYQWGGLKFVIMSQYGTGVLDETYTLQLSNGSNVFFIDLTADMLYINDENDIYGYDGKVDLKAIKIENYDSAYIMYNNEIIADITLVIYNKNEVFSEIYFKNDSAQLIIGSQAEIIEQLKDKSYYYSEKYDFDIWSDKEIYMEYLGFSDFTLGYISNIDFNKCGDVRIPIEYRNRTTYLDVQLIPNLDLYTSKSYMNQYYNEFILYSNGYYETTYSQNRIIGTYEFMNTDKNIVFLHNLPYGDYEEAMYLLNDDTQQILDLRMEGVEGFTKIGTFSDMCFALFTLYENNGIYYGEMYGKYYDSEGTHIEYRYTLPIDYDPVKERIYMWNAEYVIGEYDEENKCFPIEIPMSGKTKYEYVDTEDGEKWAYNDNWVAYYCVSYNNDWHCVSFWDWRYNEDQTKINEYYYDLDNISNVVDISDLTEVIETNE